MSRPLRISLVLSVAILAIIIAARIALGPLIERVAVDQLTELGVPNADLRVSDITLTHLTVAGVKMGRGGELEIKDLRMTFAWRDLLFGKIQSLNISGLTLKAQRTAGGLSFGDLDALFLGSNGAAQSRPVKWPVDTINMADSMIEIASPFGTTVLPLNGTLRQTDNGEVVLEDATIHFVHPNLNVETGLNAILSPDGMFKATLSVKRGALSVGHIKSVIGGGMFKVSGPIASISEFTGDGTLTVRDAQVPFGFTPEAALRVRLDAGTLSAEFAVIDTKHGTSGLVRATLHDIFTDTIAMDVATDLSLNEVARLPAALGLPQGVAGKAKLKLDLTTNFDAFVRLSDARNQDEILRNMPTITIALEARSVNIGKGAESLNVAGRFIVNPGQDAIEVRVPGGIEAAYRTRVLVRGDAALVTVPLDASRVTFAGFDVLIPEFKMALNSISGHAQISLDTPAFSVTVGEVVDHHRPLNFRPLTFSATGHIAERLVKLSATLTSVDGVATVGIEGEHDLNGDKGFCVVRLNPLTFGRQGARLGWYFPLVKDLLMSADGLAMGAARVTWQAGIIDADADLVTRGLSLKSVSGVVPGVGGPMALRGGQVALKVRAHGAAGTWQSGVELFLEKLFIEGAGLNAQNINAVISFDDLWPPTTAQPQRLSVAVLDAGLPLTDGEFAFVLPKGGTPRLMNAQFRWAGGTLTTRDVTADSEVRLNVNDIDLGELVRLFDVKGLSASGTLEGDIPFAHQDGTLIISGAVIEATGPGTILYRPEDGGGLGQSQVLLDALGNFHFDTLTIALDGAADGIVNATVSVYGRNPEYLDGYPVELTLTLAGRVAEIINTGITSYRVPETIKNRMLEYGQ